MNSKETEPGIYRLEKFLDDHGYHLLTDSRQGITIGKIYTRYPSENESSIIGDTTNFIIQPVKIPDEDINSDKKFNAISEDLTSQRSRNIFAKAIAKFIGSIGFSFGTKNEQLLEIKYLDVSLSEIDPAQLSNRLSGHSFNTQNMLFKPDKEYFIVTRILESKNIKVRMKVSKDLKATLDAEAKKPNIEGVTKFEYVSGNSDEAILTYLGEKPLVFAVNLYILDFVKDNGKIIDMKPLKTPTRLLEGDNAFVWNVKLDNVI